MSEKLKGVFPEAEDVIEVHRNLDSVAEGCTIKLIVQSET